VQGSLLVVLPWAGWQHLHLQKQPGLGRVTEWWLAEQLSAPPVAVQVLLLLLLVRARASVAAPAAAAFGWALRALGRPLAAAAQHCLEPDLLARVTRWAGLWRVLLQ